MELYFSTSCPIGQEEKGSSPFFDGGNADHVASTYH